MVCRSSKLNIVSLKFGKEHSLFAHNYCTTQSAFIYWVGGTANFILKDKK
jgi:hypothetical protein